MDVKEEISKKSVLLMIAEDIDKLEDFVEQNYKNRKYNSSNFDQGKKFFMFRYIKNKFNSFINSKSTDIKVENKIIQQLDSKEKEKLDSYEKIYLNHKKTNYQCLLFENQFLLLQLQNEFHQNLLLNISIINSKLKEIFF